MTTLDGTEICQLRAFDFGELRNTLRRDTMSRTPKAQLHPIVATAKEQARRLLPILKEKVNPDCKLGNSHEVVARFLYQKKNWSTLVAMADSLTEDSTEALYHKFITDHLLPMMKIEAAKHGLEIIYMGHATAN